MNDATFLIVLGLGFDIVGAFFIVEPILRRFVWIDPKREQGARTEDYVDKARTEPNYEQKSSNQAWTGFGFLAVGFLLQIIGNILQNPLF